MLQFNKSGDRIPFLGNASNSRYGTGTLGSTHGSIRAQLTSCDRLGPLFPYPDRRPAQLHYSYTQRQRSPVRKKHHGPAEFRQRATWRRQWPAFDCLHATVPIAGHGRPECHYCHYFCHYHLHYHCHYTSHYHSSRSHFCFYRCRQRVQFPSILCLHGGHTRASAGQRRTCVQTCCPRSQAGGNPTKVRDQRQTTYASAHAHHGPPRTRRQSRDSEWPQDRSRRIAHGELVWAGLWARPRTRKGSW